MDFRNIKINAHVRSVVDSAHLLLNINRERCYRCANIWHVSEMYMLLVNNIRCYIFSRQFNGFMSPFNIVYSPTLSFANLFACFVSFHTLVFVCLISNLAVIFIIKQLIVSQIKGMRK